mgnify:FL=1
MKKDMLGWTLASVFVVFVFYGLYKLIEDPKLKALSIFVMGMCAMLLSLVVMRGSLKLGLMVGSTILLNGAAITYWKELTDFWKAVTYISFAIQLLYLIWWTYRKYGRPSKTRYTGRPSVEKQSVNILEFCKAKFAEKEKVDECIGQFMAGFK